MSVLSSKKWERELSLLNEEKFPALKSAVQVACFNAHLLKTLPDSDEFERWREQVVSLRNQQVQLGGGDKGIVKGIDGTSTCAIYSYCAGQGMNRPGFRGGRLV